MNDKLKVDMYVRTRNGIGKIDETRMFMDKFEFHLDNNKGRIHNVNDNTYWNSLEDVIGEPSYKVIDLVQEGDLVTIKSKYCEGDIYQVNVKCDDVVGLDCFQDGTMYIDNNDIKTVVTKEQFEREMYEVNK